MQGLATAKKHEQIIAQTGDEHRYFRRVKVDLPGRLFVPSGSSEVRCTITDLSPGGAGLVCQIIPQAGIQVVLYVEDFGCFEGHVVRRDGTGFGIAFVCTPAKRERTAEQLILFLNKTLVNDNILRRHERFNRTGAVHFTCANGQIATCEVTDISMSGMSLKTDAKPAIGELVTVAQTAGRVVRHHAEGIAIEFVDQETHADRPLAALFSFALRR